MEQSKIRFSSQNKRDFVVELREKVNAFFEENNISKYGNKWLKWKTVIMFVLYITPFLLMLMLPIFSIATFLLYWAALGVAAAGIGMGVMHDANHRSYSKNTKTNNWLGRSLYLVGGFPANWRHQHNTLHHGFTNIDGVDEDIAPVFFLRLSPHTKLLKMHRYQYVYAWILYGLMTFSWVTMKDFKQFFRYTGNGVSLSGRKTKSQLFLNLVLSKLIYYSVILVLPIIVLPLAWYWIVIGFLFMHFTTGIILGVTFQTAHVVPTSSYPKPNEQGIIENNWAVHQLSTTSDFSPGNKLLTWYIGGLNYQVEHHLFPNISHVHYPKISSIVKELTHKYDLPYFVQPNLFTAIIGHIKMLRMLGR